MFAYVDCYDCGRREPVSLTADVKEANTGSSLDLIAEWSLVEPDDWIVVWDSRMPKGMRCPRCSTAAQPGTT